MFFPGALKLSFEAGKVQYLVFRVLLESGHINNQPTPGP